MLHNKRQYVNWFKALSQIDDSSFQPERPYFRDEGLVEDESGETFWGSRGSGCLFIRNHSIYGKQILAVQRSSYVQEPNTWGTTGGAVPMGETDLFASALRETEEEIGRLPKFKKVAEWTWQAPGGSFTYTNYILEVLDLDWEPETFNWEVDGAQWITVKQSKGLDMHFGLSALLDNVEL